MKRLLTLLRCRKGATLAEMMAAMALLGLALILITMLLPPAARTVQRMEDLNDAQMIAGTLLDNIRGELELAQGYIKCYDTASPVGQGGKNEGNTIEFHTATNHVMLISDEKCAVTNQKRPNGLSLGNSQEIPKGQVSYRYYTVENDDKTYYFEDSAGNPVARAVEALLGKGFYGKFQVALHFKIADNSETVQVKVTVSREEGRPVYEETLTMDLRYIPPLDETVTAKREPSAGGT